MLRNVNIERRLDCTMVRPMLRVVDFALEYARCQLLRRQHQVDRGSVNSILPGRSPARQEALEAPFVHKVDDRIRLPLPLRPHLVSTSQLVMAVEVASDDDIEAWAAAALRDMYCLVE
jgi:hypothetical protein